MSENGTVEIVEETGEPIAKITVGIIEIKASGQLSLLAPGFYFTFPRAGAQPNDDIALHGPAETREDALEAAGSFLIDAAHAEAGVTQQDLEQELAA